MAARRAPPAACSGEERFTLEWSVGNRIVRTGRHTISDES
jgi:hypothetical protein